MTEREMIFLEAKIGELNCNEDGLELIKIEIEDDREYIHTVEIEDGKYIFDFTDMNYVNECHVTETIDGNPYFCCSYSKASRDRPPVWCKTEIISNNTISTQFDIELINQSFPLCSNVIGSMEHVAAVIIILLVGGYAVRRLSNTNSSSSSYGINT